MAGWALFLDDERQPVDNALPEEFQSWVVARSYAQVEALIEMNGLPKYVSFDHDLGEEKTGLSVAQLIVDTDIKCGSMDPDFDYYVHSQNPIGKKNITGLLEGYLKHRCAN